MKRETSILAEAGSTFCFRLYSEWLRVCDDCHGHNESYVGTLPTRVIDIGDDGNSVRLRITSGEVQGIYIALSHRWQRNTPTTTISSLADRRKGIELDALPKTYKDAICVARNLGVRFLWIDSLCIVQDDPDDWASESRRMEEVYASAYCTIAASSASDGFLSPPDIESTGHTDTPVAARIDGVHQHFQRDVERGKLNQRGWVLQERALSRRVIHFTGEHAYWECGAVIWSTSLDEGVR